MEELQENAGKDIYPYHMPGHKRRCCGALPQEIYSIDITEIDGFDNLHQPEGILRAAQQDAARLYGAEESFYLVNGSSCGILSALSCALPFGGRILMARNCHKSAYHGVYLRKLAVTYLYPPFLKEYDIFDAVEPWQVQAALDSGPDIKAVLIVSPTYEGRISDIRNIADIVHAKGIPLIVDEAHGAHLGLAEGFHRNSCQSGADLVIHSIHKTLPSLTQTALLHVNGDRIDRGRLRRFLRLYQSSSPSYVLMAGIDNALRYVEEKREAFRYLKCQFESMAYMLQRGCRHLRFVSHRDSRQDIGKLLISVKGIYMTGRQLYDLLLLKYHLQLEMASKSFALAMFTINDGEEAYRRMTQALLDIDSNLGEEDVREAPGNLDEGTWGERDSADEIPLAEAWDMETEMVPLEESHGRRIGEFINLYPPGVPLLVPGERMTEALHGNIRESLAQGLQVQGLCVKGKGAGVQMTYIPAIIE